MERPVTDERVLVYDNEPTTGARMTSVFALATFALSLFLSWFVFTHMTHNGELATFTQRSVWAGAIALGGAAFLAWAWVRNRKVTSRIYFEPRHEILEIVHPALLGNSSREVALSEVETANSGDPRGQSRAHAPYIRLGVHHGRSFVVNLPGHIHRYDVFTQMLQRAGVDPTVAQQKHGVVETLG